VARGASPAEPAEQKATPAAALDAALLAPGSQGEKPDVVFIALHGKGGEDGTIQGMLELLGLPYTGSGVLASALAMDKAMTKHLFRSAGIPVLEDLLVRRGQALDPAALTAGVCQLLGGFPVFVKPNAEGSTFGCTLVASSAELPGAIEIALQYDALAIIERYARGMEITVGVLGNTGEAEGLEALPVIEIVPKAAYYDYESKYAEGGSEHIIPARLSEALLRRAQEIALRCHELLGCRGMSRTDMIVAGQELVVLEVNTIPGMTPTSLLPQAAAHAGIPFSQLLDRLIASALRRE
jgi:D-alanine-D-alanine ligase